MNARNSSRVKQPAGDATEAAPPRRARLALSRRTFLKASGALVVSFSLTDPIKLVSPRAAHAQITPNLPTRLDGWLAIAQDGTVTLFSGKVDLGTGVETALAQIAAEELDVAFDQITVVQGDTARSPDQEQTVGSFSVSRGGAQIRRAAAEARYALVGLAAERLGVPADQLRVQNGVVSVTTDSSRRITYGALVGGRRLEMEITGEAPYKNPSDYRIVGQSIPRVDIPAKMTGGFEFVQNVRRPGMLHGRVVRPTPQSGARLLGVDESSVQGLPGNVRVVTRENWVGVVADREEHAIRAAKQLKVSWSEPAGLPNQADLFTLIASEPNDERLLNEKGDVVSALSGAAKTVSAIYQYPAQIHAMMGPVCAVADVRDGRATVWSGTQYPQGLQRLLAQQLPLAPDNVHVIYTEGSGCYGRYTVDDAALDAAWLSQAVGRPVRVQWMREDEHGWDHANTPMLFDIKAGLDARGHVVGYDYQVWSANHVRQDYLGELTGGVWTVPIFPVIVGDDTQRVYDFDSQRLILHAQETRPVRFGNNRSLGAMPSTYASESFMDELAAAAGADPLAFRLQHVHDDRASDVLKAAAERSGWDARSSPNPGASRTGTATGRGIAVGEYGSPELGGRAWVATIAEVEVDQVSGRVRVPRIVIAHDCGFIVNPDGVRNQIEGNVLQSVSRSLFEEVEWDRSGVTTVDWRSYRILTFPDVPDVEIVLVNRTDMAPVGAGEAASIPTAAAIGNAIFDATGVRLRRVPFTSDRVQAALRQRA